jgi:ribosome-interacting GTPase 1
MPTNLPPEAAEAERRYRAASTPAEKIACIEELLGLIPKHKGTDKLRADYRKRLSKLKSATQGKKSVSRYESVYRIDKEGAGTAAVIGPTNVGKSALVATLTNATPEVADYPFTTWQPTPGMMNFENVQVQLLDTPALDRDFVEPELLDLIRRSDIILLVVDLQTDPDEQLEDSIAFLESHRIVPIDLKDRCADQRRTTFIPLFVLANKCDDESCEEVFEIFCELLEDDWPLIPVSATTGRNLEHLRRAVFERLQLIRVYAKPPGDQPDLGAPFLLDEGSTVADFAGKVHQDFYAQLKTARVWGHGVYDGQMVSRDHVLHDGDIVELRI